MKRFLKLEREKKIEEFLKTYSLGKKFEASGVCVKDANLYVIFDNLNHIARIGSDLSVENQANGIFLQPGTKDGYEDICFSEDTRSFFLLIEASKTGSKKYRSKIIEYDESLCFKTEKTVNFTLEEGNKGLEGLASVYREGLLYLLGLCEGNHCLGEEGENMIGNGRILILQEGRNEWECIQTVSIPSTAAFLDYSAIDIKDNRVVVTSQKSSALWVGRLNPEHWEFADLGSLFYFPNSDPGKIDYCNVEGIAWLDDDRVATVSDKAKSDGRSNHCRKRDESIHLFRFPAY